MLALCIGRADDEADPPILWLLDVKSRLIGKNPDATEDEIVGWHHGLNGHEFEQTPGNREGQRSLACYSPWGHKERWLSDWITMCLKHLLYHVYTQYCYLYPSSVQLNWVLQSLCATPWTAARQASLSITNSQSLLKLISIKSVMPSNHLILCHFLLLLPSIFSSIRVFSKQSVCSIRWPKHWSFSFSISPSNERSGLISFRMDWFDLLAVQGTLKSLLQHHSSKATILRRSAFFMVQLSHLYMTTGKTIALSIYGHSSAK